MSVAARAHKLLKLIDKTLKGISQEERDQMWDACLDRQPA